MARESDKLIDGFAAFCFFTAGQSTMGLYFRPCKWQ